MKTRIVSIGNSQGIRIPKPLLDELAAQAATGQPTRIVSVNGLVRDPGNYPLEPTMRISDLIRAGGGLGPDENHLGAILHHSSDVQVARLDAAIVEVVGE